MIHVPIVGRGPGPAGAGGRMGIAVALLAILFAADPALAQAPPAAPGPSGPPPALSSAAACDGACVRALSDRAAQACAPGIEAQAPNDYDWLQRPYGNIFQQGDTPDATHPVIRYRGDSIRYQSPQKDWVRVSYECSFDPVTLKVMGITVRLGRLDRPPPASTASAAPAPSAKAAPAAGAPTSRPPAQARNAPRRNPGEASEIEFFQVKPQNGVKTQ